MEYFVETNNYSIAHDKALDQLALDVKKEYLAYYDNVVMTEQTTIKGDL